MTTDGLFFPNETYTLTLYDEECGDASVSLVLASRLKEIRSLNFRAVTVRLVGSRFKHSGAILNLVPLLSPSVEMLYVQADNATINVNSPSLWSFPLGKTALSRVVIEGGTWYGNKLGGTLFAVTGSGKEFFWVSKMEVIGFSHHVIARGLNTFHVERSRFSNARKASQQSGYSSSLYAHSCKSIYLLLNRFSNIGGFDLPIDGKVIRLKGPLDQILYFDSTNNHCSVNHCYFNGASSKAIDARCGGIIHQNTVVDCPIGIEVGMDDDNMAETGRPCLVWNNLVLFPSFSTSYNKATNSIVRVPIAWGITLQNILDGRVFRNRVMYGYRTERVKGVAYLLNGLKTNNLTGPNYRGIEGLNFKDNFYGHMPEYRNSNGAPVNSSIEIPTIFKDEFQTDPDILFPLAGIPTRNKFTGTYTNEFVEPVERLGRLLFHSPDKILQTAYNRFMGELINA